jgi:hypothetical protein
LQVFSEPATKEVLKECWEYFDVIEPGFGLMTAFRSRLKTINVKPLQITFERLESLAEQEAISCMAPEKL